MGRVVIWWISTLPEISTLSETTDCSVGGCICHSIDTCFFSQWVYIVRQPIAQSMVYTTVIQSTVCSVSRFIIQSDNKLFCQLV